MTTANDNNATSSHEMNELQEEEHLTSSITPLPATSSTTKPHVLDSLSNIKSLVKNKSIGIFLDYDGTLTPIVSDPNAAQVKPSTSQLVNQLSLRYPTSVVTGRKFDKIQQFLASDSLYYATSHGFEIRAPQNKILKQVAQQHLPLLKAIALEIQSNLEQSSIKGSLVEDNIYSISVHYRNLLQSTDAAKVYEIVQQVVKPHLDRIQILQGKMVYEIRPLIHWHKGQAVQHLLTVMYPNITLDEVAPICLGDDTTDEDAFRELEALESSITILVLADDSVQRMTNAKYVCRQDQVEEFLRQLLTL